MNWWKHAQSSLYHGTKQTFDNFDPSKSDPSSAWGPGMYTTPEEDDAKAWAKKGLGNGPERVISVPKPTGKIFPADGLIPPEDLPKLELLLGHNRYTQSKEPVPGTIVYMSLERKLGSKAQVNAALKSIGYQGLTYSINRGKDMQHTLIF